ncbi:hypothetical protein M0804_011684 [Polistes exclamans]|nr:hypothetical protein M0804_011684 [Polistes exclamans]
MLPPVPPVPPPPPPSPPLARSGLPPGKFRVAVCEPCRSIVYANRRANPGNPDTSARLRWPLRPDYSKIPSGTQCPQMESTRSPGNLHSIPNLQFFSKSTIKNRYSRHLLSVVALLHIH